ncbi:MAG TPA: arylsulfatase [Puia sp.]|nr:arylsulfatase [Puia sp.]
MKAYFIISMLVCGGVLPLGLRGPLAAGGGNAAERPDIVLIMADDMGFSDIGCYGGEIKTPNIDALAREGIRFTRMYNNAFCSPTRASLLTGLYPHQVGLAVLADPVTGPPGPYQRYLSDRCVTIAEVLKQAGYRTEMSGKWHLGESRPYWPVDRGFDHYFGLISGAANYFDITKDKSPKVVRHMALDGEPYTPPVGGGASTAGTPATEGRGGAGGTTANSGFYMTDAITSHAVAMLRDRGAGDAPLFLYVAYTAPHFPLQARPEDIARYAGAYDGGWDSLRCLRYDRQLKMGLWGAETKCSPRDAEVSAWDSLSTDKKKEMAAKMAVYAAQVDRMDQGIGWILKQIKTSGREKNTIVIFLSDNGGCAEGGVWGFNKRKNGLPPGGVDSYMSYGQSWANASNTPFRYFKKWLHEGGISTPLIVRWPARIAAGRRGGMVRQVGHVVDLLPTLCAVTGARYPAKFKGRDIPAPEGQSLLAAITEGKVSPHRPIYWALNGHKAVLAGDYKLEAVGEDAPWELYDLSKDRAELDDLAAKYPGRVKEMADMWQRWADKVGVMKNPPKAKDE